MLLVSDTTVIARPQDDDVTIRSWRHSCAGNFVALPVHQSVFEKPHWRRSGPRKGGLDDSSE